MAVIEGLERRIVGVDTHKDLHVAAVVDEQDRVLGTHSFATTGQGYRQMLAWMRSLATCNALAWNRPAAMALACCALCSRPELPCSR
jgi:hypothetical protein